MKKFYFLLSAFLLSMTMMMVSCGSDKKSDDDKEKEEEVSKEEQVVRDFEKLADAYAAALEKGDKDAASKIEQEVSDLIMNNMETLENLDDELKKRFEAAGQKAVEAEDAYAAKNASLYDDDEEDTTVESYEYDDADYGMSEEDAAALGF